MKKTLLLGMVLIGMLTFPIMAIRNIENNQLISFKKELNDAAFTDLIRNSDENWAEGFGILGVDGYVRAIVKDNDGNLYIGGNFSAVHNITVNNIAMWDGNEWLDLGGGANGSVSSLLFDGNGVLHVGGSFTEIGGIAANNIAIYRFAALRRRGFLALNFIICTKLGFSTSLS